MTTRVGAFDRKLSGKHFYNLPCCPISRWKKIIIHRKTSSSFFDHRTVYESKNCNQFPHSTDFIFIKITWISLIKINSPLSQILCLYRSYDHPLQQELLPWSLAEYRSHSEFSLTHIFTGGNYVIHEAIYCLSRRFPLVEGVIETELFNIAKN